MKIDYWNFHRDYRNNKTSYNNIFKKVLNSKSLILGPEVRNLEKRIPRYLGSKFGVGVNSCTDALLISPTAAPISANIINDEIRQSIINYEPRVNLLDVITNPNFDNNAFDVIIIYEIIGADIPPQELQFALQSTR